MNRIERHKEMRELIKKKIIDLEAEHSRITQALGYADTGSVRGYIKGQIAAYSETLVILAQW